MTGPGGGFQVDPAVIDDAATTMAAAETTMTAFGDAVSTAATDASGAAGEGPLEGALMTFGTNGRKRSEERGHECQSLSQEMRATAEEYRARDGQAAASLDAVRFGS